MNTSIICTERNQFVEDLKAQLLVNPAPDRPLTRAEAIIKRRREKQAEYSRLRTLANQIESGIT